MEYRGGTEKYHDKYVYICQPVNYIEEGLKRMDVWSGYIVYYTNASSKKVGTYGSLLNQNNSSYGTLNMNNQRNTYGQQYNDPYRQYQYQYQQQTGIYSSIKNTVTNSMFLKR